jgi:hypothetical protein
MKFVLEVDLDDWTTEGKAAQELGRILRYWAGNVHHYQFVPGDSSAIYDSAYHEVGQWRVTGSPASDAPTG